MTSHQPSPDLIAAVEAAYAAFAREPAPTRLNVCRCPVCFGDDVAAEMALIRTPLRELTASQLAEYTNSAHGWDDQMLYFLPRYLELIAYGDHPAHTGADFTLSRLAGVDWRALWPAQQSAAVEAFFARLVEHVAQSAPPPPVHSGPDGYHAFSPLGETLRLVVHAGSPLDAALARLDALDSPTANLHLAALVLDLGAKLFDDRSRWHHLGAGIDRALIDWLLRAPVRTRLEAAFYRAATPEAANTLSLAVAALEGASASGS